MTKQNTGNFHGFFLIWPRRKSHERRRANIWISPIYPLVRVVHGAQD
jgi:hypothetical protein